MRFVIQRVNRGCVKVSSQIVGQINKGLMVLVGISDRDTDEHIEHITDKLLNIRLFDDDKGNRWKESVKSLGLDILLVSQFTLYHILKGNKPDFHEAMGGEQAKALFDKIVKRMREKYDEKKIQTGAFGEYMQIDMECDGPVTINWEYPAKKENDNNENNKDNKKEKTNKESDKERYMGNGLFKEESANFITQLKRRDQINSFAFSIKYNNDDNGEIIIGDLPHEYSPEKYSPDNYFFDTVSITKEPPFNWHFTYKKCSYGTDEIDKSNTVKFSIDFGFIKGNSKLKNFLENNFFNLNSCYKNQVKDYEMFYCKKDAIKNFKPIIFELQSKYCANNANAKFEFTYEDLFIKDKTNNDIYYFQIVFDNKGLYSNWIFGKPLFKKYQMVFDQDKKTYGFYLQPNNKGISNINNINEKTDNASSKISWVIVVILLLVSLVLIYLLRRYVSKLPRKLKANELEENFSYDSNNSKYNQIDVSNDGNNQLYKSF